MSGGPGVVHCGSHVIVFNTSIRCHAKPGVHGFIPCNRRGKPT